MNNCFNPTTDNMNNMQNPMMGNMNNMQNPMMGNMNNMQNPMMGNMNIMQNPMMGNMNIMQNPMMGNANNFNPMMGNMNNMNNNFNPIFGNLISMQNQIINNFKNNFNNQIQTNNNLPSSDNIINVFFIGGKLETNGKVVENTEGPKLSIYCKTDEKVSEIIKRYRTKSGFHEKKAKFIFNAKNLCEDLTVAEAKIQHNSIIFVISLKGIQGAYHLLNFDFL